METSFYVIKPHGLAFREEIRAMIKGAGLTITESKELVMHRRVLEIIYSDLPEKYRDAVFRQFNGRSVEMGLVMGENAVDELLQITGTELDPVDCVPGSIRFKFGGRVPSMIDGVRCYANVIHRPRNNAEAEIGTKVFRML
ncbi:MAG: nucleoside-diphosphate kinase [Patescibacteria group bacterium]